MNKQDSEAAYKELLKKSPENKLNEMEICDIHDR